MPMTPCQKTIGLMTTPALLLAALLAGARGDDGPPVPKPAEGGRTSPSTQSLFSEFQQLAGAPKSAPTHQPGPVPVETETNSAPAKTAGAEAPGVAYFDGSADARQRWDGPRQAVWSQESSNEPYWERTVGHGEADSGSEGCATCQDGNGQHRNHHHGHGAGRFGPICEQCAGPMVVHEGREYRMTGNPLIDWWKKLSMRMHAGTMRRYYQAKAEWWDRDRWNPRDWDENGSHAGWNDDGDSSNGLWMQKRLEHLRCRYGYFLPTGCCGAGCPTMGKYNMVYPANPDYIDPRDGQIYGAQGYGVPMAVPLAPNVDKTYNYGWGVPSSRLTPVSRRLPVTRPGQRR